MANPVNHTKVPRRRRIFFQLATKIADVHSGARKRYRSWSSQPPSITPVGSQLPAQSCSVGNELATLYRIRVGRHIGVFLMAEALCHFTP